MKKTGKTVTAVLVSLAVILGSTLGCFAAQKASASENAEAATSVEIMKDTEAVVAEAAKEVEEKN